MNRKRLLYIICFCFTFNSFALSIADFDLEKNQIPQKITNNFLNKCTFDADEKYYSDFARFYVTELGLYVVGWSTDGKLAYFEEQYLYPFGPYLYFYVFDTVTDTITVSLEFKDYNFDIKQYVSKNAKLFDEILDKYKINFNTVTYEEFPLITNDSEISINIKYYKQENIGYIDQINTYDIQAIRGTKYKKLNTEKDKNCNTIVPVGYIKSPYENRIAVIVINSRYTFEESEMFASFYGCHLNVNWTAN